MATVSENLNIIANVKGEIKEMLGASDHLQSYPNAIASAMTDEPIDGEWLGVRPVADGASIRDGVAFVSRIKGKTVGGGKSLPPAYQEVEYLESHGEEYIETGLTFSTPITARGKIAYLGGMPASNMSIFSPFGSTSASCYIGIGAEGLWGLAGGCNLETPYTEVLEFTFTKTAKTTLSYITDGKSTTSRAGSMSAASPMYLFKTSEAGAPRLMKIYHIAIECNDISADLVPCYRRSDNVAGMYDTVSGTFYTNSGTGSLTYGAEVGGVNSKPEAIVSGSYNLLDESVIFANGIWARSDEGYSALTNVINGQYGGANGFMSGFKANTQYTISWKAKVSTSSSRIRINYTDGSYGLVCRTTLVGEFEELNGTSQSGKTIDRISFDYAGANTTTIAWLQIEEGTTATKHGRYMAPYRLDIVLPSLFADGLASAGDIYDEIDYLHNVAIKRVGVAEPITEPIDAKAWYKVASGGSEEAVCGNGVPLVAEIAYRKDYTEILNDYELAKTLI